MNNPNLEPENSIETYVKMDTDTGLVYEAKKQMQLNMFIQENLIKRNEFDLKLTQFLSKMTEIRSKIGFLMRSKANPVQEQWQKIRAYHGKATLKEKKV